MTQETKRSRIGLLLFRDRSSQLSDSDLTIGQRAAYYGFLTASQTTRLLGERGRQRLAQVAGDVLYDSTISDKRADPGSSHPDGNEVFSRAAYRATLQNFIDNLWLLTASRREIQRAVQIPPEAKEQVDRVLKDGGAILAEPHRGRYRLAPAAFAANGYPLTIVTSLPKKPVEIKLLNRLAKRQRFEVIPVNLRANKRSGVIEKVEEALREGKLVGIMSDVPVKTGIELSSGERVPAAPAVAAKAVEVPIFIGYVATDKGRNTMTLVSKLSPSDFPDTLSLATELNKHTSDISVKFPSGRVRLSAPRHLRRFVG